MVKGILTVETLEFIGLVKHAVEKKTKLVIE
jgi:hypothetical protein